MGADLGSGPYGGEGYGLQSAGTFCPRGEMKALGRPAISGLPILKLSIFLQVAIRKRKYQSLMLIGSKLGGYSS